MTLPFGVLFVLWCWGDPKPSLTGIPAGQRVFARLVHIVIYVAIIARSGVGIARIHGHAVPFYGLFHIPQSIAKGKAPARCSIMHTGSTAGGSF